MLKSEDTRYSSYVINTGIITCVMVAIMMNNSGENNFAVSILILFMNLLSIFNIRKNWYMFIIYSFITYSNYSVLMPMYMSQPIDSIFAAHILTDAGTLGLNILCVFSLGLLLISSELSSSIRKNSRKIINLTQGGKYNPLLVLCIMIALVYIFIFEVKRPKTLGLRASGSPLSEYSIILMILGFYYSSRNKIFLRILQFIGIMYVLQELVFGGRITACQYMLATLLSVHTRKLKLRFLIPVAFVFCILMFAIGGLRATLVLQKDITGTLMSTMINALKNGFVLDTAYAAYHASMTFLKALDFTGQDMRLYLFSKWVIYLFAGSGIRDANLPAYTRKFMIHYGGGFLPYYAYFYLGVAGLVIMLFWLRYVFMKIVRNTGSTKKPFIRMISIYVASTVLRWWLYSPSQITRALFLFFLLYCATSIFERLQLKHHYISGR